MTRICVIRGVYEDIYSCGQALLMVVIERKEEGFVIYAQSHVARIGRFVPEGKLRKPTVTVRG